MENQNQKRAGNFSEEEIELLIDLISERETIIECKQTDTVSMTKKRKCWEELTVEFNRRNDSIHRDEKVLRKKYDNLKKDLKKCGNEKRNLYDTAKGTPQNFKKPLYKNLNNGCYTHHNRTSWQNLADIKVKWLEERSSIERQNIMEEHKKRMRILDLQEDEAKCRLEEAKKRLKLLDLEFEKMENDVAKRTI